MTALPSGVEGVMVGDIGSETDWSEALDGIEGIVHLAARVHVMRESVVDPLAAFRDVNVAGTECLARQAAEAGVKRLVYLSSVKVHGEENDVPYSEEDTLLSQDPYGVSKYEAEEVLKKVAVETGLEIVILRPPLVYGLGVKANFLRLLKLIHKGIPLPLGLVRNRRSMVYLDNLVSGILACLEHHRAAGETFLVSDGEDVSTAELVQKMASAMGRRAVFLPVPVFMLKALAIALT
jgi:nucleoside-diphosphate-sugar epimerase